MEWALYLTSSFLFVHHAPCNPRYRQKYLQENVYRKMFTGKCLNKHVTTKTLTQLCLQRNV